MRIDFIKSITDECSNVIDARVSSVGSIDMEYRLMDGRVLAYRVYQPTGEEYLLGKDVIDSVHRFGVNVIVSTIYTQVSNAARGYAESKGIKILSSAKQYKYLIENGENIGFK